MKLPERSAIRMCVEPGCDNEFIPRSTSSNPYYCLDHTGIPSDWEAPLPRYIASERSYQPTITHASALERFLNA